MAVIDRQEVTGERDAVGILTFDDLIGLEGEVRGVGDGQVQLTIVEVLLRLHVFQGEEAFFLFLARSQCGLDEHEGVGRVPSRNQCDTKRRHLLGLAAPRNVLLDRRIPNDVDRREEVVIPIVVILFRRWPIQDVVLQRGTRGRRVGFTTRGGFLEQRDGGGLASLIGDDGRHQARSENHHGPGDEQERTEDDEDDVLARIHGRDALFLGFTLGANRRLLLGDGKIVDLHDKGRELARHDEDALIHQ